MKNHTAKNYNILINDPYNTACFSNIGDPVYSNII